MKNSIFKSFLKKMIRSEAFVSVAIVFVLAIGIIGTSYALYMDVDTDTNYQVVQVGDLYVGFSNDGDNTVTLENMFPMEDEYALDSDKSNGEPSLYSFYIYNSGTYTSKYSIKLITSEGNEIDTKYINYIVCRDNADNCSDVRNYGSGDESIVTNDELSPKKKSDATNPSVYYFLKIWVNSDYVSNNNVDGEKIVLKVIVESTNASGYLDNTNTLAGAVLNNENIKIYNNKPNFTNNEVSESGIYKTEDNNGISYYFRGDTDYNYVNFSNKCFRVVRIEGNGKIKLVLANNNGVCGTNTNDESAFIKPSVYNSNGVINFEESEVKQVLNYWVNSLDSQEKLKEDIWCINDLTNAYDDSGELIGEVNNLGSNTSYNYSSYNRLNVLNRPSLKCDNTYKSNVGLLSADEVYFAGNSSYLKDNAKKYWWTLTPANHDNNNKDSVYWVDEGGNLKYGSPIYVNNNKNIVFVRPSIILAEDTMVVSGNGTINEPYVID